MSDAGVSDEKSDRFAIVLYDGTCHLCNGWVRFVLPRDRQGRFRFAALQSEVGRRLLREHGLPDDWTDSLVVVEAGQVWTRSAGVLAILRRLPWPWPLAYGLVAVPKFLRDGTYDLIARHRYRWFGHASECLVPSPEFAERFLDRAGLDS